MIIGYIDVEEIMTNVEGFKVVVCAEATREMMIEEQYSTGIDMYEDEWNTHEWCNEVDDKLERMKQWDRDKCRCNNGFKKRCRKVNY